MPDVEVRGAEQLTALAKRLRQAGDKDLQRELYAGINRALKPLKTTVLPASARNTLPKRGGLAARTARTKYVTKRRTSGRAAGIRLEAKTNAIQRELGRMDRGQVRHPVYARAGRARVWVAQPVTPGWFTKPTEAAGPVVRAEITKAMDEVAAKL